MSKSLEGYTWVPNFMLVSQCHMIRKVGSPSHVKSGVLPLILLLYHRVDFYPCIPLQSVPTTLTQNSITQPPYNMSTNPWRIHCYMHDRSRCASHTPYKVSPSLPSSPFTTVIPNLEGIPPPPPPGREYGHLGGGGGMGNFKIQYKNFCFAS